MNAEKVGPFQAPLFVLLIKAKGRAEGWAVGFPEGCDEGFRGGQAKGLKAALLKIIARAGLTLGDEEQLRIDECNHPVLLNRLIDNALVAKTSADLFLEEPV